jgi:hypothetical protein
VTSRTELAEGATQPSNHSGDFVAFDAPDTSSNIETLHLILSTRFSTQHTRLTELRTRSYGTAYQHCLIERHIMSVCAALGIQLGRHITPALVEGVAIRPEDVARWFGIVPATFSTMRTEFKLASVVHRILRQHGTAILSPADIAFRCLLDAMLGNTILDPISPLAHTAQNHPPGTIEAVTINIGPFMNTVRDVKRRLGGVRDGT